jgi:hypothetical protein
MDPAAGCEGSLAASDNLDRKRKRTTAQIYSSSLSRIICTTRLFSAVRGAPVTLQNASPGIDDGGGPTSLCGVHLGMKWDYWDFTYREPIQLIGIESILEDPGSGSPA